MELLFVLWIYGLIVAALAVVLLTAVLPCLWHEKSCLNRRRRSTPN
jgi:hypothetical protein